METGLNSGNSQNASNSTQPVPNSFGQQQKEQIDFQKSNLKSAITDSFMSILATHSPFVSTLLGMERNIDNLLLNQKYLLQNASQIEQYKRRKLNIYAYVTHTNQMPTYCENDTSYFSEPPSWSLKIEGEIESQIRERFKFTHFVSKLHVNIELSDQGQKKFHQYEFNSDSIGNRYDGFEVNYVGDKQGVANITIFRKFIPERFQIDDRISKLLPVENPSTFASLMIKFWEYLTKNNLLSNDNSQVQLNDTLKEIFEMDFISTKEIPNVLLDYCWAPEPIVISIPIEFSISPKKHKYETYVDIPQQEYSIPPLYKQFQSQHQMISQIDDRILSYIKEFEERDKKRKFLQFFADSPSEAMNLSMNLTDLESSEERLLFSLQSSIDNNIEVYFGGLEGKQEML